MKIHLLLKWSLLAGSGLFLFILAAFIALVIYDLRAQRVYAAMPDTHDLKAQINKMGAGYLAGRPDGGLVINFYQRGKESFQGFGKISVSNTNPPDAETIFEIGSVTKIFTATVLAKLAEDGTVKLDDPIGLYLPKDVVSPKKNGREITLENLATHTQDCRACPKIFLPRLKTSKTLTPIMRRKICMQALPPFS